MLIPEAIRKKIFAKDGVCELLICPDLRKGGVGKPVRLCYGDLETLGQDVSSVSGSETVLVLLQEYSWGRLQLCETALGKLMATFNMSPRLFELITAFGVKTSDDERHWKGTRGCSKSVSCSQKQHDLCYSIYHVEKHERNLKDPWSLRQFGLYHQVTVEVDTGCWLFIDLARTGLARLDGIFPGTRRRSAFATHLTVLSMLERNWPEYIEYLGLELKNHDNKVSYSSGGSSEEQAYNVASSDLQALHKMESKIRRTESAILSCLEAAKGCFNHFTLHASTDGCEYDSTDLAEYEDYCARMQRHLESLSALNLRLNSTLSLLSRLLIVRNGELLQESNQATHGMLVALIDITKQSRQQQETLAVILSNTQADSAMLKTLSTVATVCLPPSLVAAIFSSDLIYSSSLESATEPRRLVVSSQFWVFVVITVPLMTVILSWTYYLNRKSRLRFDKATDGA